MKKSLLRPSNHLNSPSISHQRSQTNGSGIIDQSRILEETSERFQRTWNILESVEELKSVRQIAKQIITEPCIQPECQLGGIIISGKVYKVSPMEFYYCNIGTRGQKSPLNCTMFCDGEFQIMISFNSPFPTKFNCDQVIRSRQWAVRHSGEDKLHLAVVARKQTEIRFLISFGQADTSRKLVRLTSNHERIFMSDEISKTPQFIVNQNKVQAFKRMNKYEIEVSRSDRFLQILKTRNLQKKNVLDENQTKTIEFKAKEWARTAFKLITQVQRNRNIRKEQKHLWFELLYFIMFVDRLQAMLRQRRKQLLRNKRMIFGLQQQIKKFIERRQIQRGDLQHRVIGDTLMCLMIYCKQTKRRLIHNSLVSVLPVLKLRAQLYMFKKKGMITSGKLQLIKVNLNQFVRNVRDYKIKMIQKWDQYTLKIHTIPSLQKMDKRFIVWIKYLYEKGYQVYFQNQFITLLMRDRYRSHIREQREIKKLRQELKTAKLQLRFARESIDILTLRQRIFKLSNDIFAMQVKNQFFIHSDVERFVNSILEQSSFIFLDEDTNQLNQEKQSRMKVSLKRQKTMRISKNL